MKAGSSQLAVFSLRLAMRDTDTDFDGGHRKKKDRKSGSLSGSESNVFLYAKRWCIQLKNCQLFQDGAKGC